MGYSTYNVPRKLNSWEYRTDNLGERLTIPRSGSSRLKEVCESWGTTLKWLDRRTVAPCEFPFFTVDPNHPEYELRYYQQAGVEAALKNEQGIIKAPTGSGKTIAALNLIYRAQQRALVVMRDRNLLNQWLVDVKGCLGLSKKEIGFILGGRKYFPGRKVVLALQQTLYSRMEQLEPLFMEEDPFGIVVIDEAQTMAGRTYLEVIDRLPAKMRVGFSADETRRDGKVFLIHDVIGKPIHSTTEEELEAQKIIHPVTVRVVETNFRADWYRGADPADRDFKALHDEMIVDSDRNALIVSVIKRLFMQGEVPALVFTRRREHAHHLAIDWLIPDGIRTGLLLGGGGSDAQRFQVDRAALLSEKLDVGVGTFTSLGVGHNIPVVRAGICATPISGKNHQFFRQVKGRFCRSSKDTGKTEALLYYILDSEVFPNQMKLLEKINKGRVQVLRNGQWVSSRSVR